MNNDCSQRKDLLMDAALTGTVGSDLAEHLRTCADCSAEFAVLRAKREQLDALLPLVAQGADLSPGFHARVLAAAETTAVSTTPRHWRLARLSAAMAAVAAMLVVGLVSYRRATRLVPENDLAAATKLAEWRAPSDVLLETPGRNFLLQTPQLGESYLHFPKQTEEENENEN
jgi:anti-sigma factor RsiW